MPKKIKGIFKILFLTLIVGLISINSIQAETIVKSWEFNTNNNREGWTPVNYEVDIVNNGKWVINPTYSSAPAGSDPQAWSPTISGVKVSDVTKLVIRMGSYCADGHGHVYFISTSGTEKVDFQVINDDQYREYSIPIPTSLGGNLTQIRIDPALNGRNNTYDDYGFDYIRLVRSDPNISVSPTTINESLPQGWYMVKTVTISNTGEANLSITNIITEHDGSPDFLGDPDLTSTTISPGSNTSFHFNINAINLSPNSYTGRVKIYSNDPDEPIKTIDLNLTVTTLNPQVSVSPPEGPRGTTFSQPGTGFSNLNKAILHFKKPDGNEYPTAEENTDGSGNYSHSWTSSASSPIGVYEYWAVDNVTQKTSNHATFKVLPPAPNLVSPANESSVDNIIPLFKWTSVSGQTDFRIAIYNSSNCIDDNLVFNQPFQSSATQWQYTGNPALENGKTYWWKVNIAAEGQNSPYSEIWSFTVNIAPPSPPTAPTNLTATAVSSSKINLLWQDNSNNEEVFKLERKTGNTGTYNQIAQLDPNATSYSDSGYQGIGLEPNTTYFYRVRAYNSVGGDSNYSNEASTTTPSPSPIQYPDIRVNPTSFTKTLAQGTYSIETVTIYNDGNTDLTITAIDQESGPPTWIGDFYPSSGTITAGSNMNFSFHINAINLVVNPYVGKIKIHSNDPDTPVEEISVNLTVTGTSPPPANNSPTLSWTGETNYASDGLNPESGDANTDFVYRVKYADVDNDPPASGYPKVHIKKGGAEISGSPFSMSEVDSQDTNYADGKIYSYTKSDLAIGTDYTYYFEAKDNQNNVATGDPTNPKDAPDVSESGQYVDTTLPTGKITYPTSDSKITTDTIKITAEANDVGEEDKQSKVKFVRFYISCDSKGNNSDWKEAESGVFKYYFDDYDSPYEADWDFTGIKNQTVSFSIMVEDNAGNKTWDAGGRVTDIVLDRLTNLPILNITKSVDKNIVTTGDTFTYTITFGNSGISDATNILIEDVLQPDIVYKSANNGGIYDSVHRKVTWVIQNLPAGVNNQSVSFKASINDIQNNTSILNTVNLICSSLGYKPTSVTIYPSSDKLSILAPISKRNSNSSLELGIMNKRDTWYIGNVTKYSDFSNTYKEIPNSEFVLPPWAEKRFSFDNLNDGDKIKFVVRAVIQSQDAVKDIKAITCFELDLALRMMLGVRLTDPLLDKILALLSPSDYNTLQQIFLIYVAKGDYVKAATEIIKMFLKIPGMKDIFTGVLIQAGCPELIANLFFPVVAPIFVNSPHWLSLFSDSIKIPFSEEVVYSVNKVDLPHGMVSVTVLKGIDGIRDDLGNYIPHPELYDSIFNNLKEKKLSRITFACPVNVLLTDKLGRRIGYVDSQVINEIPLANIEVIEDTKIIDIPTELTCTVETTGTATGSFDFTGAIVKQDSSIEVVSYENVFVEKGSKATMNISPGSSDYSMKFDFNGDGIPDEDITPNIQQATDEEGKTLIAIYKDKGGEVADDVGKTKIEIPAGILPENAYVEINRHDFDTTALNADSLAKPIEGTIREFIMTSVATGQPIRNLNGSVTIAIPYTDENQDGIVDGTDLKEESLKMFYWDEDINNWQEIKYSQVHDSFNNVTADVNQLTKFCLMSYSPPNPNLEDVELYPNPCDLSKGEESIKFTKLPPDGEITIQIYTCAGTLVKTLKDGEDITLDIGHKIAIWNLKNEDGERVARGVYAYVIKTSDGKIRRGKIGIIKGRGRE